MSEITSHDPPEYKAFLEKTNAQIHGSRVRAATADNRNQIALYWWIGEHIVSSQKKYGWGKSFVELLSQDLKAEFSHKTSFSPQNLRHMRQFYLAEQADKTMKDVYILGLLGITELLVEAEMKRRMVSKIKDVILELSYGFSFIDNENRSVTPDSEYFIDLLFYHRKLQSLVAVELKTPKFRTEFACKINLYLNLLDDFVKEPHENPSIGIILYSERGKFDVECYLRGIDNPVGVSGYELTHHVPEKLKDSLPDPEELDEKLSNTLSALIHN